VLGGLATAHLPTRLIIHLLPLAAFAGARLTTFVVYRKETRMFIAMNRFQVRKGQEPAFEKLWAERDTQLDAVPGFVEFHLLRGPEAEDHTLYSSHTIWASQAAFQAWTQSEAFRQAHKNAGDHKGMYLGHPNFEGFHVVQQLKHSGDAGRV